MMIKNSFPSAKAFSATLLLGALSLFVTGCAKRLAPSYLDVRVINRSRLIISDIELENNGFRYSSPSLTESETYNALLELNDDNQMILRYSDPIKGEVEEIIRIPARKTDGGEMNIEIFENGFVKPSSRFDLYNDKAAKAE